MPTPIVPSGPGSIHRPGPLGCTTPPEKVTMSPPSPMNIEFSVRNSLISCARRSGWIGACSFMRRGWRSSFRRASSWRRPSTHCSRLDGFADLRPLAALAISPRIAPGSPTRPRSMSRFLPTVRVVHVDLDDLGLLGQALAVAHAEVERRADDQDQVGVVERVAAREVEVVRVAGRQGAAGGAVHVRRDVERADEVDRVLVTARGPHLGAEQDAGPLGGRQHLGQLVDVVGVADALRRGAVAAGLGDHGALERHLAVEDVAADLEERPGRGRRTSPRGRPSSTCRRRARWSPRSRRTW